MHEWCIISVVSQQAKSSVTAARAWWRSKRQEPQWINRPTAIAPLLHACCSACRHFACTGMLLSTAAVAVAWKQKCCRRPKKAVLRLSFQNKEPSLCAISASARTALRHLPPTAIAVWPA